MCGFCGVIGPARRADADHVEAMARAIAHRGPDDRGSWSVRLRDPAREEVVALAHRRLSILDLSPLGHQPMTTPDGRLTIAFNGEIYNFRELRRELEGRGTRFCSNSDTEVILLAFSAWGVAAFARLNGMFAFALFDSIQDRLYLVRDRVGIKPLYYRFDDGLLLFGSELKALRAHPAFPKQLDRGALGRYLRHGYVCGPETIYAGTRRLMPGDYLVWQRGQIALAPYVRWDVASTEPPPERFEEAVGTLDRLLAAAVERQLVSDVPLGAFLSGGIDSSTVVALMQERSSRPVRTFSIGFHEEGFDEAPAARAVASHLGTEHTELYVGREDAIAVAEELPTLYDEPFADVSAIPTVLLSRMTRRHVKVALSGDGGDELFGGYRHYRQFSRLLPALRFPRPVRRSFARLSRLAPRGSLRNALAHLRAADAAHLALGFQSAFDGDGLSQTCGVEGGLPTRTFLDAFAGAPANDDTRRFLYADARTYLPDDILVKLDRASMSVGLEARVPILDDDVVAFTRSLPFPFLWNAGAAKAPLREILYRRLPRALVDRPKQGFGVPIHRLLRAQLDAWSARHLAPDRLQAQGILDPQGVAELLASARARFDDVGEATARWRILCFQRWYDATHSGDQPA